MAVLLEYITIDISRKCVDEAGTPPLDQNKIVNIERYILTVEMPLTW